MGAEDVEFGREEAEEEVLGEFLDGQDIDKEGIAPEALKWEGFEDRFGGGDGSAEDDDIWVLLAEVIRIGEERDAKVAGHGGVVRAGVGEDGVALPNHGFGEELAEVSESNDGNFELGGRGEAV